MANLFGRLFGNGGSQPKKSKEAFFLDPDSAKTFGDIDYMRKPNRVRHTFPKVNGSSGAEIVEEVNATGRKRVEAKKEAVSTSGQATSFGASSFTPNVTPAAPAPAAPAPVASTPAAEPTPAPAPVETPAAEESKPAPEMDMFLSMARNIRKR
ncbi:MAG: hypothetical protein AAGG02_13110 [Cyanobacteria bacterium P01_H01_bin.15]